MWRALARSSGRPCSPSLRAWKSTKKTLKSRATHPLFESPPHPELPPPSHEHFPLYQPGEPIRGRIVRIATAFAAGFSIYFFLEDPNVIRPLLPPPKVSPSQYVPTRLASTETSGPDTKLLKIVAPPHLRHLKSADDASIWSVYIKDDDIQVERAYTPLNGVDDNGDMLFWIKKYPKGEVGRWLHSKSAGERIEVRGPLTTWSWKEDLWDEVVMISGGTGVTPFVQLFNNVISKSPSSKTRFTLLHSSRILAELPPPVIIEPMVEFASQNPDKFRLHIFVDESDGSNAHVPNESINTGRISEASIKQCLHGSEEQPKSWWAKSSSTISSQEETKSRIMFLVCGPEPMIDAIAGPYGRNLSQGTVAGILGKMGYQSNEVYKL
ncbi:ferredoxin reductase-like protein [Pholiota conissans]|uniref:Ferredoxin reductase-like protein n=1 Tax=Pholiota conissans TaxID=109636 RepID=A0A9P6CWS7_9AGAR|nr:ferredoxin reductase-like protein [Pholiota conissans]